MGDVPAAAGHLSDAAVEARLARLDDVLGQLEQIPGRTAELALEAVETLTEVYGEALGRAIRAALPSPDVVAGFTGDELLRHLLLLHRLHPDPVEGRVARAVADLRPQLASAGADVELVAVEDGIARLTVSAGSACGARTTVTELAEVVREQVLTAAPELADVQAVAPEPAPTLIPVEELLRRPGVAAVGGRP